MMLCWLFSVVTADPNGYNLEFNKIKCLKINASDMKVHCFGVDHLLVMLI